MGMYAFVQQLAQTCRHLALDAVQIILANQVVILQWVDIVLVVIRGGMMIMMGYEMVRTSVSYKQKSSSPFRKLKYD
jgi:hypothetical protein